MIFTSLGQRIVVRYARKPIWAPTAPSKLFRITDHKFYTKEEVKKILSLHATYKAETQSVAEFMKHNFFIPASQAGGLPSEYLKLEAELEQKYIEENQQENARIMEIRKKDAEQKLKDTEDALMLEKFRIEERLVDIGKQVDEYVINLKSDAMNFVTRDNIDQHLDKALDNPTEFEFCIDLSGRQHTARKKAIRHERET